MKYPETKKDSTTDNYFGTIISDPYRWLEDDNASDTKAWVTAQNEVTANYLRQIPFRDRIKDKLTNIWNYPKESAPFKVGKYYLVSRNDGLQNQNIWYIKEDIDGDEKILLNPNELSKDGTSAVSLLGFSPDYKYMAYSVAQSGSDWSTIYVMDLDSQNRLDDELKWTKFSGAAWTGEGFYYSGYDQPDAGMEFSATNQFQKVYFHKLGNPQELDQLVYQDRSNPNLYLWAEVTEDLHFLVIHAATGTSGNALLYQDLTRASHEISTLVDGYTNNHHLVTNVGNNILVSTDLGAPNKRIVSINPLNPAPTYWAEIIPESTMALESISTGGGFLWTTYLKDASSAIFQFTTTGDKMNEIQLPAIGTASGFGGFQNDTSFYYTFSNFTTPGTIYHYDIATSQSVLYKTSAIKIDTAGYETSQVFYNSKDGTAIPMFIVHKKGIVLDGENPVFLYGYGGFQVSLTPSFSLSRMLFLEKGGIYAQPSLRGGGEYGEAWHQAGMLEKKQNVFDDFIAAAEFLIEGKYTNRDKIAISGGSNGGLLVGACMSQRPDLFRVALPAVGVLDMLRYHMFTVGHGWTVEYGSSDQHADFQTLLNYSPLHQLKTGVIYPSTLITTADHDDRVVPAHSFKFAATLQEVYNGNRPMLIRIETKAGHGAGKPTLKMIEEATDVWSFVFQNLEIEF